MKTAALVATALAALVHLALIANRSPESAIQTASAQESPPEQNAVIQTQQSPRRLTINVAVVDPSDLKVSQG